MAHLLRGTLIVFGHMPLAVLHGLATLIGSLMWLLPNNRKRIALRHLELCLPELPDAERRTIGRRSLIHFCKAILEAPAIWFGPEKRLKCWLADAGAQKQLDSLVALGGNILLCPHIGSWELSGMFCAQQGAITTLYKPQKGAIDALILEGRSRLGATLVPTTGGGVRALLHALREGHMIGVLPDQDPP